MQLQKEQVGVTTGQRESNKVAIAGHKHPKRPILHNVIFLAKENDPYFFCLEIYAVDYSHADKINQDK